LVILPNNSNVVLTARQVQELTPHDVKVIATETIPQGIGALLAFNFQSDMQTNMAAMEQAARAVHTVEVTRAVRDADLDSVSVRDGEFLGISNGRVVVSAPTVDQALLEALSHTHVEEMEIVTLYYGSGVSREDAEAIAARIRGDHTALAVEVVEGGQPHYPYVVSLE
jgi:fatty acid kinase